MTDSIPLRHCNKCNNDWPSTLDFFYADARTGSGFRSPCKQCLKDYESAPHRKAINASGHHTYYLDHKETANKRSREWAQSHQEHGKQYRALYYQAHRQRYISQSQAFRQTHAEYMRTYKQQWAKSHIEHRRASRRRREARKRNAPGTHTVQEIREQYDRQKKRCYYCKGKVEWGRQHVDHVIPLSRGGSNDISNLVITCPTCNLRKNDRLPHEWPQGGRLL